MRASLLVGLVLPFALSAQILPMGARTAFGGGGGGGSPTFDSFTDVAYTASGGNSASHSGSGTNLIGLLFIWTDGTLSSITCGGSSMTLLTSHALSLNFGGSFYIYSFLLGSDTSSKSYSYSSTGNSTATIVTVKGAKQSGQPDATAFTSGTQAGSGDAALSITTVADNSFVIGMWNSVNNLNTPSGTSNGTLANVQQFITAFVWYSATNPSPAGAFTLKASSNQPAQNGTAYEAVGVSLTP